MERKAQWMQWSPDSHPILLPIPRQNINVKCVGTSLCLTCSNWVNKVLFVSVQGKNENAAILIFFGEFPIDSIGKKIKIVLYMSLLSAGGRGPLLRRFVVH